MERIWIYQGERKLTDQEAETLLTKMSDFAAEWTAHGKDLAARVELRYNQFLIIYVNEAFAQATGCSIDKSTNTLKQVQQEIGVDFFDRMKITYQDGVDIKTVSRSGFEKLIENGDVNEDTIVFNNMVANAEELERKWEIPLKDSWHAQVF